MPGIRNIALKSVTVVGTLAGLILSPAAASAAENFHDGDDPITSGCVNYARSLESATVDKGEDILGSIDINYSAACGTAYALVSIRADWPTVASITRDSDGKRFSCDHLVPSSSRGYTCYTPMISVYGAKTAYASAVVTLDGAQYTGRTKSY